MVGNLMRDDVCRQALLANCQGTVRVLHFYAGCGLIRQGPTVDTRGRVVIPGLFSKLQPTHTQLPDVGAKPFRAFHPLLEGAVQL